MPTVVTGGSEFQVNTFTTGYQGVPAIAVLAGGGFVVTWSSADQDGDSSGVYAQRYDAAGVAQGAEFRVNSFTAGFQTYSVIAALAGGGFVVGWHSLGQDGDGIGVYAQRYDAVGVAQGGEFLVNSFTAGYQVFPTITGLEGGGFVVSWSSANQDGDDDGVYAQRYDAAGVVQGGEFLVNTTTVQFQAAPAITALEGGGFIVSWRSSFQDGDLGGIYAQRYDAAGVAQGGEFRVNTFTSGDQYNSAITALDGGGFVVSWTSSAQDGDGGGIYAQRYDAAGVAQGGEFRVNTVTADEQFDPAITALDGGGFVVTWTSDGQDGSDLGIYAQCYDAAGTPAGGEFLVNMFTAGDQSAPTIAALEGGGFVVSWESENQDGDSLGVFARTFTVETFDGLVIAGTEDGDVLIGTPDRDHIDGRGGNDTISGLADDDTLLGGTGNDTLIGGDGADLLDGGRGRDTASYRDALTGITVSLTNSVFNDGYALGDVFVSIENLEGSRFGDRLGGNADANDFFGGDGQDIASYYWATAGVVASLSSSTNSPTPNVAQRGDAAGDRYNSIEVLEGSNFGDVLFAANSGSNLWGLSGADTLYGLGGNDVMFGDGGNDALYGDGGTDFIYGGTGQDTLRGDAGADALYGESEADRLDGGGGADRLDGGTGDDIYTGGAGADLFVIRDEGGQDTITDFKRVQGDKIDLRELNIDEWIGTQAFHNDAGEVRLHNVGAEWWLEGDTDGDGVADFLVALGNVRLVQNDVLYV